MRCRRFGDARLARLADKFGQTETIAALLERFKATCPGRPTNKSGRRYAPWSDIGLDGCAAYCPDLGATKPPDLPPAMAGLSLIEGGKADMLPAEPVAPKRRRVGGLDDV